MKKGEEIRVQKNDLHFDTLRDPRKARQALRKFSMSDERAPAHDAFEAPKKPTIRAIGIEPTCFTALTQRAFEVTGFSAQNGEEQPAHAGHTRILVLGPHS